MNGLKITTTRAERLCSIAAYVGAVDSTPHNQFQVALYSDQNGAPSIFIASSVRGTLMPHGWNTLPLAVKLAANTSYWLLYNTNASRTTLNELQYDNGPSGIAVYSASRQAFGAWPASFTPSSSRIGNWNLTLYANVAP